MTERAPSEAVEALAEIAGQVAFTQERTGPGRYQTPEEFDERMLAVLAERTVDEVRWIRSLATTVALYGAEALRRKGFGDVGPGKPNPWPTVLRPLS